MCRALGLFLTHKQCVVEMGQMSSVETETDVSAAVICPVSTADICPVSTDDIYPCLLYTSDAADE